MAQIATTAIEGVEKIQADVLRLASDTTCVTLKFEGRDYFKEPGRAHLNIYIPSKYEAYARAIAAAINAVPVPEQTES